MNTKATTLAMLLAGGLLCGACSEAPASKDAAAPAPAATVTPPQAGSANPVLANATPTPEIEAMTNAVAAIGPHKRANLPPIPFRGYAPPRPPDVVTAAFLFAAEHPEVTSYVPCFCGCQQGGHKGNHDCFVRSRAANGDVIEWEEHGVECGSVSTSRRVRASCSPLVRL